jgi:glutamate transport system substrate-binding protein
VVRPKPPAKNRTLRAVGMTAIGLSVIVGCSSKGTRVPSTMAQPIPSTGAGVSHLEQIRARGRITIGVKKDVPLFGLADAKTGKLSGFDIEIAKGITKRIFPKQNDPEKVITFVEALSKNRETLLQKGTVDLVVSTYTINDARKQLVDFSGPYYIAGQDVLTSRKLIEEGAIRGIDDVNGRRVCSVRGSTSLLNLQKAAPKADVSVLRDKYSECFQELQAGRVDAMTTDDVILLGLSKTDPTFALTGNPFRTEPYGVGIPKGDNQLKEFINDALEDMINSGEWADDFRRTIGTAGALVPPPPAIDRY